MIKQWFCKTRDILKPMTWSERVEYLWEYYKWQFIGGVVFTVLMISLISTLAAPKKETLLNGVLINVTLSEEGQAYLTENVFPMLGGTDTEKQEVTFTNAYLTDESNMDNAEAYSSQLMSIVTWAAAGTVDYMLMDQTASDHFCGAGTFADLSELLTPQQLEQLEDRLVYYESGEEGVYPVAVDISDISFVSDCVTNCDAVYIGFLGNTGRSDKISAFVDFLLAWGA